MQLPSLFWPCLSSVLLGVEVGPPDSAGGLSRSERLWASLLLPCLLQDTYTLSYHVFWLRWSPLWQWVAWLALVLGHANQHLERVLV